MFGHVHRGTQVPVHHLPPRVPGACAAARRRLAPSGLIVVEQVFY
jgi:hypothetical protein